MPPLPAGLDPCDLCHACNAPTGRDEGEDLLDSHGACYCEACYPAAAVGMWRTGTDPSELPKCLRNLCEVATNANHPFRLDIPDYLLDAADCIERLDPWLAHILGDAPAGAARPPRTVRDMLEALQRARDGYPAPGRPNAVPAKQEEP